MSRYQRKLRAVRAGLTVSAVGAAVLAVPAAAFAATTVGPLVVMPGSTSSIMDPQITFVTTPTVQFSTTSCPGKLATAGTGTAGPWNASNATRNNPNSVSFTVPSTNGPVGGPTGAVKPYFVCSYDGAVAGTSNLQAGATIYVGAPAQTGPSSGTSGGGNQVTVNTGASAVFTGVTAPAAVFTTGACNATLGATNTPNLVATNVTKQSPNGFTFTVPPGVTTTGANPTQYNICLYDGSAPTGGLLSIAPYTATLLGVSPASGSYLASNGITVTSPSAFLSGVTTPAVLLVGNAGCPGTWATTAINGATPVAVTGTNVRRLLNNRAAVTVPPLPLAGGQPTTYQVCVYGNTSPTGPLLGSGTYTAGIVAQPTAVFPAAGPAAGGNAITVIGTDFPTDAGRITATLGGVPLTNIQSLSDKAFTAQAPAHSVEANVALVVSTSAGTRALPGAYSYLNPIRVAPNTAPNNAAAVDISVGGTGFLGINFGTTGNAGRIFLVDGTYNGADAGAGARANGPVAECLNVLPLSDEELICTLQLNRRLNAQGNDFFNPMTYVNTLTTDISTVAGSRVVVSATGKFNANDLGQPIVRQHPAEQHRHLGAQPGQGGHLGAGGGHLRLGVHRHDR